jgi:uncharacterized protein (DUF1697 family)
VNAVYDTAEAMAVFIALLRGINVGGANLLPMQDLVSVCEGCGITRVRTWIQSGNVVFESRLKEDAAAKKLQTAVADRMGKPIAVMVRPAAEMRRVLDANPFPAEDPSRVLVAFLDGAMPPGLKAEIVIPATEQVRIGQRELYVFYPEGMGQSRLRLPLRGTSATMRNIHTLRKLVAIAEA